MKKFHVNLIFSAPSDEAAQAVWVAMQAVLEQHAKQGVAARQTSLHEETIRISADNKDNDKDATKLAFDEFFVPKLGSF